MSNFGDMFKKFTGLTQADFDTINRILETSGKRQAKDLADLKQMARAGIFNEKSSPRKWIFTTGFLKDVLRNSGVSGYVKITVSTTKPTLPEAVAEVVRRTSKLQIAPAPASSARKPSASSKTPMKHTATVLKRRTVSPESSSEELSPKSPEQQAGYVKTGVGFDAARCLGEISYELAELRALADRYLIPTSHNDTKETLCAKLLAHWSKWMAARLRDMFEQRRCTTMEHDALVNLATEYGIPSPRSLSNFELCSALTKKMLDLYLTAKASEFGLGDIGTDVVDELLNARFNIADLTRDARVRLAALAIMSVFNPALLNYVNVVPECQDPELVEQLTAEFERAQRGLLVLNEMGDAEQLDNSVSVLAAMIEDDEIAADNYTADNTVAEVTEGEYSLLRPSPFKTPPPALHVDRVDLPLYDLLLERARETNSTYITVPGAVASDEFPKWFGVSAEEMTDLRGNKYFNDFLNLHVGNIQGDDFVTLYGKRYRIEDRMVGETPVLEEFRSGTVAVLVIDGVFVDDALLPHLEDAIDEAFPYSPSEEEDEGVQAPAQPPTPVPIPAPKLIEARQDPIEVVLEELGYNQFAELLRIAGIRTDSIPEGATIFAPTNEAIDAMADDGFDLKTVEPAVLRDILLLHIVRETLDREDLEALGTMDIQDRRVETLAGSDVYIFEGPDYGPAEILESDQITDSKGTVQNNIHGINDVIDLTLLNEFDAENVAPLLAPTESSITMRRRTPSPQAEVVEVPVPPLFEEVETQEEPREPTPPQIPKPMLSDTGRRKVTELVERARQQAEVIPETTPPSSPPVASPVTEFEEEEIELPSQQPSPVASPKIPSETGRRPGTAVPPKGEIELPPAVESLIEEEEPEFEPVPEPEEVEFEEFEEEEEPSLETREEEEAEQYDDLLELLDEKGFTGSQVAAEEGMVEVEDDEGETMLLTLPDVLTSKSEEGYAYTIFVPTNEAWMDFFGLDDEEEITEAVATYFEENEDTVTLMLSNWISLEKLTDQELGEKALTMQNIVMLNGEDEDVDISNDTISVRNAPIRLLGMLPGGPVYSIATVMGSEKIAGGGVVSAESPEEQEMETEESDGGEGKEDEFSLDLGESLGIFKSLDLIQ